MSSLKGKNSPNNVVNHRVSNGIQAFDNIALAVCDHLLDLMSVS
jgi:hypothetical protein